MSLGRSAIRPHHVGEVATLLRDGGEPLRIRGAGTWMHAGSPVDAAHELHLDALSGVRSYTPDDLTITVGAGTTLAELDEVTRVHGQWCPLQAWGNDKGTVGATVATATTGPFAESLGRPRDLVLGLECVDGRGRIVRAGGKVVKNVAGFDLTRLITGSWGTLAVITELHLRLRARPQVDRSIYIEGGNTAALQDFARGPHAPLAALPLGDAIARDLGHKGHAAWLFRLGGNTTAVTAAFNTLSSLGACVEMPESAWNIVRTEMAPADHSKQWNWSPLAQRVKAQFDPHNLLNPGLLGAPR